MARLRAPAACGGALGRLAVALVLLAANTLAQEAQQGAGFALAPPLTAASLPLPLDQPPLTDMAAPAPELLTSIGLTPFASVEDLPTGDLVQGKPPRCFGDTSCMTSCIQPRIAGPRHRHSERVPARCRRPPNPPSPIPTRTPSGSSKAGQPVPGRFIVTFAPNTTSAVVLSG